jgi:hypothetical protein
MPVMWTSATPQQRDFVPRVSHSTVCAYPAMALANYQNRLSAAVSIAWYPPPFGGLSAFIVPSSLLYSPSALTRTIAFYLGHLCGRRCRNISLTPRVPVIIFDLTINPLLPLQQSPAASFAPSVLRLTLVLQALDKNSSSPS